MYNPPTYLTKKLLVEVLDNYDWNEEFIIDDKDCSIDGIKVRFPKCILYFKEGFESEMSLYIGNPLETKTKYWSSIELINNVFKPLFSSENNSSEPNYLDGFYPFASREKVILELHNLCIAVKFYLESCLCGDFHLVENYQRTNL